MTWSLTRHSVPLAMATLVLAGCASPYSYAVRNPQPIGPGLLGTSQPASAETADRIARFERLAGASEASPTVTQVFANPNTLPGSIGPAPVVRVVFDERALFDFDRAVPRPGSAELIGLVAEAMRQDAPTTQLTLLGHTDAIGSDAYNDALSMRRAQIVLQALIARGVDPAQLSALAIGRRQPIASNDTEAGRARNRRVEFLISGSLDANLGVVSQTPINAVWLQPGGVDTPDPLGTARPATPVQVAVLRPAPSFSQATAPGTPPSLQEMGIVQLQRPGFEPGTAPFGQHPRLAPPVPTAPVLRPRAPAPQLATPRPARPPEIVRPNDVELAPLGPGRTY